MFQVLRNMRDQGHSIIIITHKLNEVLSLSDRVAVLRKGHSVGSIQTSEATEKSLTEMMVGRRVDLNIERPEPVNPRLKLKVRDVTVVNDEGREVLSHAAFEAYTGEILGVAGIAGSGQKELLEAIAGLQPLKSGSIEYTNRKGHEMCIRDRPIRWCIRRVSRPTGWDAPSALTARSWRTGCAGVPPAQ